MTLRELEKRLTELEADVRDLQTVVSHSEGRRVRSWFEDTGRFADDPLFEEMVQLGRKYRESQRPRSRKPSR